MVGPCHPAQPPGRYHRTPYHPVKQIFATRVCFQAPYVLLRSRYQIVWRGCGRGKFYSGQRGPSGWLKLRSKRTWRHTTLTGRRRPTGLTVRWVEDRSGSRHGSRAGTGTVSTTNLGINKRGLFGDRAFRLNSRDRLGGPNKCRPLGHLNRREVTKWASQEC